MSTSTDRRRTPFCLSATLALLSMSGPAFAGTPRKPPSSVLGPLACMMKTHSSVLHDLLPMAPTVSFRYAPGDIPGTSPEGRANAMNVFVYGNAGRKAVLMTAIAGHRGWHVLDDYYVLVQAGQGWTVVDGNGGQATYAAIAVFANEKGKLPLNSIRRNRLHATKQCELH